MIAFDYFLLRSSERSPRTLRSLSRYEPRSSRWLLALAALASAPAWAQGSSSANYAIPADVLNAGVAPMTSTNYRLSSSLGDPFFTGSMSSATYRLGFGLWPAGPSAAASPVVLGAVARKQHGGAGTFDLVLNLVTSNPTTEPRTGGAGGNHTVVFVFDRTVTGGTASVTAGPGTAGTPTFNGNEMTVPLSGVANEQYVTVGVNGVSGNDGSTGGSASVRIGFLLGDASQNRVVTVSDLAQINAQIAQPVTAANYLKDVNASGTLTVADKGIANTQITNALPPP